ncbi:hypothetical protein M5K25_016751 [Dendrobium thyrsiflorum]|uniref:Uncharacterized protein n=1 Tax=Dendrobium thyrsiflorum TaxID=117978 RepID=A0ABD0USP9_DENTH
MATVLGSLYRNNSQPKITVPNSAMLQSREVKLCRISALPPSLQPNARFLHYADFSISSTALCRSQQQFRTLISQFPIICLRVFDWWSGEVKGLQVVVRRSEGPSSGGPAVVEEEEGCKSDLESPLIP